MKPITNFIAKRIGKILIKNHVPKVLNNLFDYMQNSLQKYFWFGQYKINVIAKSGTIPKFQDSPPTLSTGYVLVVNHTRRKSKGGHGGVKKGRKKRPRRRPPPGEL